MVHKHKSPVARIGCARVKKSIMYLTMHKQKSTRQPIVPQQSTQNTQFEHCQPTSEKNQGFSWLSPAGALGYRPQKLCLFGFLYIFIYLIVYWGTNYLVSTIKQTVLRIRNINLVFDWLLVMHAACCRYLSLWLYNVYMSHYMWYVVLSLVADWRASFWFKVSFDKSFINIFLDWSRLHLIQ